MMNKLGSLNYPVVNIPGSGLLDIFGTSIKTGLQKKFLETERQGSKGSPVYYSYGSLNSLIYFVPAAFLKTNLGQLPSSTVVNTPVSLDSLVVNALGSRLQM
jgi:hypothetical protein